MKTVLASLMLLTLAACSMLPGSAEHAATPPAPATSDTAASGSTTIDASACAAQGGTIRPVCRRQLPACVIAYADAGKTCSNDSDCAGKCVREAGEPTTPNATVTGQCQVNSDPCGCRTEVDGGKARTICVD